MPPLPMANRPLVRSAMAYVLAGGRGTRLLELTDARAKPAVYFGGKSRIIDFALSNALNSGIRRIGVATQYKAHSLIRHMQRGWNFFRPERNESFDILPASQRTGDNWYAGTADAVYQNIDIIQDYEPQFIIILAGDHVYKMDYEMMLADHVEQDADVTVGCIEVPRMQARALGVMAVDANDRITDFVEKPADPPAMPDNPDMALASMGIYVFPPPAFLIEQLRRDYEDRTSQARFRPRHHSYLVQRGNARAHRFSHSCVRSDNEKEAYWRDVGTVDAYFEANIDLTAVVPALDLYDREWPIWTYAEISPPAKFVHDEIGRRGMAVASLVSGGCIVSGGMLRRTLLFSGVHVHSHASIENAVILPDVDVGADARLKNVIVEKGVHIPPGLVVGEDPVEDARRFRRTEKGVCLITRSMIEQLAA